MNVWIPSRLHFLYTLNAFLEKLTKIPCTSWSAVATKCGKYLDSYGKLTGKLLAGGSEQLVPVFTCCFDLMPFCTNMLTCHGWVLTWRKKMLNCISHTFLTISSKQWATALRRLKSFNLLILESLLFIVLYPNIVKLGRITNLDAAFLVRQLIFLIRFTNTHSCSSFFNFKLANWVSWQTWKALPNPWWNILN